MSGETNIRKLLQTMSPAQIAGEYVLVTTPLANPIKVSDPIGCFREAEGITYILPQSQADQLNLTYDGVMAWITLQVHSSLHAVGLTAAVSTALADAGISCNVVAAFYHDHLFVPIAEVGRAMIVLEKLAQQGNEEA